MIDFNCVLVDLENSTNAAVSCEGTKTKNSLLNGFSGSRGPGSLLKTIVLVWFL